MEKRKKILLVVIIILVIVAVLAIFVITRMNILKGLYKKYEEKASTTNYHFYLETKDSNIDYYRKNNIIKVSIKQNNGDGHTIFWSNLETNEKLEFLENQKTYYNTEVIGVENFPGYMILENNRIFNFAINPTFKIKNDTYNGKECYCIKFANGEEWIEKETGLVLYNKENGEMYRKVNYSFGNTTDTDIEKPDLSKYTFIQK